ncbi:hypothetical protein BU26DRAFT_230013 [Trematosphaeria pertusa]|uniref:Uncharacterized protein n=1 Tax=Trematosphaeria pertusa TaxID=390896 RepID=A0A6A6IX71_9PLEO|nr:uncharacterized protein BU26DRAFT_230013 [Trematosphaeria pertusa]KAF2253793.1 hypothetical protein BU26DRAFT_230013 [Trematosphaeria pertusa]
MVRLFAVWSGSGSGPGLEWSFRSRLGSLALAGVQAFPALVSPLLVGISPYAHSHLGRAWFTCFSALHWCVSPLHWTLGLVSEDISEQVYRSSKISPQHRFNVLRVDE